MRNSFGFLILTVLFCLQVDAASLTTENVSCACPLTVGDRLEKPQAFGFGRFTGKCIDSCRFRNAEIIKQSSYQGFKIKRDEILVGNVLHMEKFYTAIIPLRFIKSAQIGFELFLPRLSHVFLRFELASGAPDIRLLSQTEKAKVVATTRSIIISSEGVPPKDHKYSLVESYFGQYLFAHRVTSQEELERWTKKLKHPVRYYHLDLTPQQAAAALEKGLAKSNKDQLQTTYQLFTNNCATSALDLIYQSRGFESLKLSKIQFDRAMPFTGPLGTLRFLQDSKLVVE